MTGELVHVNTPAPTEPETVELCAGRLMSQSANIPGRGGGMVTPFSVVADLLNQHNGTFVRTNAKAQLILDAIPDGWAKIGGEWVQITSDGVGYGEFDRVQP